MKLSMLKITATLAVVVSTIFLISWTKSATQDISKIGEEELFNGLVFMKGNVANMVPELKEAIVLQSKLVTSKQDEQQVERLQASITERIKMRHPQYLKRFKQVITSGNQYAIEAELQKADEYATDALGEVLGMDFSNLETKKEAVAKLLGNKLVQLKDLYRKFQTGEIAEAEFKMANETLLADKKEQLIAIFSNSGSFNHSQIKATGAGACIAFNLAFALNVATYVNIAVTTNIYANRNVYIGVNYWRGTYAFPRVAAYSLSSRQYVNSVAKVFKQ